MNTRIVGLTVLLAAGIVASATAAAPPIDTEFRANLHWQPAPTVTITVDRAYLPNGPTLEQIVDEGEKPPAKTEEPAKTSQAVVEGELIPLRYRRTINRYFILLIRRSAEP